jgi:endonuclease/exonuclease/phosphatase (EEP) superfamily protein YafD
VAGAGIALLGLFAPSALASTAQEGLNCSKALGQTVTTGDAGLTQPLRVLSWNIQKSQTAGWDADLLAIGHDRNLLLFQEATVQAPTASVLPQPLYQSFAAGYTTESQTSGVLTLSSTIPSLQCNLTAWEPWLGTPKVTNITEFPLQGSDERLLVINLHAVNFAFGVNDFAQQVESLAPALKAHAGPVLVAGDFNTWNDTRRLHLGQFMRKHELNAVAFEPDARTTFFGLPLDHIYLRGLRTLEARIAQIDTSDHNPLLVTLELIR